MVSDESGVVRSDLGPRLNPCSNGIWSLTRLREVSDLTEVVLILVLMEYGL